MDRKLIDQYAAGANLLVEGIAGLSDAQLKAFPVPGTWSIQQIVLHMLDADLIGSERMKRVVAEDNPPLVAFDETAFAKRLCYDKIDARIAADVFAKNRQMTTELLRNLPPEAFSRTGMHSERGPLSLAEIVALMVDHLAHHMNFLRDKRKMVE